MHPKDEISPFVISLFSLLFLGVSGVFLSLLPSLSPLLALPLAAFLYEWTSVHSYAMTRRRRAIFDEANVLRTYQPRARTHGHLFVPDPPTPVYPNDKQEKEKTRAFAAARDDHYNNMIGKARQLEKEMDEMIKRGTYTAASPATDQYGGTALDINLTYDDIVNGRKGEEGEQDPSTPSHDKGRTPKGEKSPKEAPLSDP